ncbi:50S ribosomal protein L28 [Pirellulimonas nuda]|uniref:Large ribosomal subunit protein bL28 n=1 Tax=Pirellulimonas nuda TaxID=2528009 RepID=A0A518DB06_9BACT|nr:50S ribosomal protein L28 [Pirellulimonas nuda]QDU88665.1 50S ribosomal protein L28 [Pirellulimonas nuda]
MARQCEICAKLPQVGNTVAIRGKRKYLGGVGTKITGITRRKFKPNLQRVKVAGEDGNGRHLLVCVQCIRSGAVVKKVQQAPFKVPVAVK